MPAAGAQEFDDEEEENRPRLGVGAWRALRRFRRNTREIFARMALALQNLDRNVVATVRELRNATAALKYWVRIY